MKYIIASDIHGSALWCEKLIKAFESENADKLILLGDILYHGPRNDLPDEYNPKKVIEMLNALTGKIMSVRGNCEAEVDQMVLSFPVLADYAIIPYNGKTIFLTHGHIYNEAKLPPLDNGDILMHGHTHIPVCEKRDGYTLVNPGSVSLPKENSHHGYAILEANSINLKDFDGKIRGEMTINNNQN